MQFWNPLECPIESVLDRDDAARTSRTDNLAGARVSCQAGALAGRNEWLLSEVQAREGVASGSPAGRDRGGRADLDAYRTASMWSLARYSRRWMLELETGFGSTSTRRI